MNVSNAIKIDPNFAMAYESRSQLFEAKGMLDKSISDITAAISINPKEVPYYFKRAKYYSKTQQNQEALMDYKKIIQLEPRDINAYYEAATSSKLINANENADVFFTQAYAVKEIQKFVTDFYYAKFLMNNKRFNDANQL